MSRDPHAMPEQQDVRSTDAEQQCPEPWTGFDVTVLENNNAGSHGPASPCSTLAPNRAPTRCSRTSTKEDESNRCGGREPRPSSPGILDEVRVHRRARPHLPHHHHVPVLEVVVSDACGVLMRTWKAPVNPVPTKPEDPDRRTSSIRLDVLEPVRRDALEPYSARHVSTAQVGLNSCADDCSAL